MSVAVSVIIPVYNCALSLRRCLDSLQAQTLEDMEFICVNDGSTDNSLEILSDYAQKDNRFKIIDKINTGSGDSRNKGIEQAQGEYIGFVDSDDWVDEEYFEKLYYQAKLEDVDICCALDRKDVYPDKAIITSTPWHSDLDFMKKQLVVTAAHLWSKIFKRQLVEKYQIKNALTRRTQDIAFSVPAILLSDKISMIKDVFYYYRVEDLSASHQKITEKDCMELAKIFELITSYEYSNKQLAQDVIKARMQCDIQYYSSRISLKNCVKMFASFIRTFPHFRWYGENQCAFRIAKLIRGVL